MQKHHIRLLLLFIGVISQTLFAQQTKQKNELNTFLQEAQLAEQEMNAIKAAEAYGKAVAYGKKEGIATSKLNEISFQYGSMLIYSGEYEHAVEVLNELLESNKKEKEPDKLLEARTYMQFGILHYFEEQWDKALYYYEKAKAGALETNNKQGVSVAENNIANIYQKKGNYNKALAGYKNSLKLQEVLKDTATICNTFLNIGTCYEELDEQKNAQFYFEKAQKMSSLINDVEILSLSKVHLAEIAIKKKEFNTAENLLTEAKAIVQASGYRQVLAEVYKIQSQLYEDKKDYKTALNVYKQHQTLSDSILNKELREKTNELETRLKTHDKEQKIILQDIKIASRNRLLWLLGIFSLIGVFVTIIIFRLWQTRNKQNKHLEKLNYTKDRLFSIISHDLKSPAIAQKIAMDSLKPEIEKTGSETLKSYYKVLHDNASNQLNIINNLLDWARIQSNKITWNPQNIDVIAIIKEETKLYNIAMTQKSIQLSCNLPDNCIVFADKQMIGIVIRNLLNNAVKFTKEGGNIAVACKCQEKEAVIAISDDGIGMSQEQIDSLYTKQQNVKVSFGTKGEKGTGLGLGLCKDLLAKHHSKLVINSEPGKGTTIRFSLNKKE